MNVVVISGNCFQSTSLEASRMVDFSNCGWINGNINLNAFCQYFNFWFNKYNDFVFDGMITHDLRSRILIKRLVQQIYQEVVATAMTMNYNNNTNHSRDQNKNIIITCAPQDKEYWLYDMPSDLKMTFIDLMDFS